MFFKRTSIETLFVFKSIVYSKLCLRNIFLNNQPSQLIIPLFMFVPCDRATIEG